MDQIKPYKKDYDYSYTLGAFPTIEMVKNCPECVDEVLITPNLEDRKTIEDICKAHGINVREAGKTVEKLSDKENVYIVGLFKKFEKKLASDKPHIVLVNPGNMGNLGTILRTAVGFGIKDIAIIRPGADIFNPKAVRASMGALFHMNFRYYDDFTDYMKEFPNHRIYTFMLDADDTLHSGINSEKTPYSLVFGNEATGLPKEFHNYGKSCIIPQSADVDSLNVTIAASVAMFVFTEGTL